MYKKGFYGGKFLPFHKGHLNCALEASGMVEELHVVLFHSGEEEKALLKDDIKFDRRMLDPRIREMVIRREFNQFPHIIVHSIDCSKLKPIEGYTSWEVEALEVRKLIGDFDVVFSSEPTYGIIFNKLYNHVTHQIVDADRSAFPISGTMVRTMTAMQAYDYLPRTYQEFLNKKVLIVGTESCVDSRTEFFNGVDWKSIAAYNEEDLVLQYNIDGTSTLVKPERYIALPTEKLYIMQNTYKTWSQVYSEDHDLVYKTSKGNIAKKQFKDIMRAHLENKTGFQGKFLTNFILNGTLTINEHLLRLLIAISADGSLARQQWRVRLLKERKIERFRELCKNAQLEIDERVYEDGSHNFYLPKQYGVKEFPSSFYNLSLESKKVFIDEMFLWDGSIEDQRYYSIIYNNAKIAQFILQSSGYKTLFREDKRNENICYTVEKSTTNYLSISLNSYNESKRNEMIQEFIPEDKMKYCFTVPSGMLILRRDNHIFITGNCGKSTLTKKLAKYFNTSYTTEYARDVCVEYGVGNPDISLYPLFIYGQQMAEHEASLSANKVVFCDTEAMVTQYYAMLYENVRLTLADAVADQEHYDLIIYLEPSNRWVDDGLRMHGEEEIRRANDNFLKELIDGYGKEYIVLNGTYEENYVNAVKLVKELLK